MRLLLASGAATMFYGVFRDAGLLARISGVWLYLAAPQALERMDVWSPEILYLPIGAAMIARLCMRGADLRQDGFRRRRHAPPPIAEGERLRARIEAVVPRDAVVIYGWRTPIPSFALRVMTRDERDLAEISRLYPREGHVNPWTPWTRRIHLPNGSAAWHYAVVNSEDAELVRAAGGTEIGRVDGFVVLTYAREASTDSLRQRAR